MKRKYGLILLGNSVVFFTLFIIALQATLIVLDDCTIYLNMGCTPNAERLGELRNLCLTGGLITSIFFYGMVSNIFMLINMVDKDEIT